MSDTAIPATSTIRGQLGRLGQVRKYEPENFAAAQRDLRAAKLRDAIEEAVATAPPLTPAQIDALTTLLDSAKGVSK